MAIVTHILKTTTAAKGDTDDICDVSISASSENFQQSLAARLTQGTLLSLMSLGAIGGNCLVWLTVLRFREFHKSMYVLLLNLAASDFVLSAVNMPVTVYTLFVGRREFSCTFCRLTGLSFTVCVAVTISSLGAVSLNRYMRVCQNQWYTTIYRIDLMVFHVAGIWGIALMGNFPVIFNWELLVYHPSLYSCTWEPSADLTYRLFDIIYVTAVAWVIIFCNVSIYRKCAQSRKILWRHKTQSQKSYQSTAAPPKVSSQEPVSEPRDFATELSVSDVVPCFLCYDAQVVTSKGEVSEECDQTTLDSSGLQTSKASFLQSGDFCKDTRLQIITDKEFESNIDAFTMCSSRLQQSSSSVDGTDADRYNTNHVSSNSLNGHTSLQLIGGNAWESRFVSLTMGSTRLPQDSSSVEEISADNYKAKCLSCNDIYEHTSLLTETDIEWESNLDPLTLGLSRLPKSSLRSSSVEETSTKKPRKKLVPFDNIHEKSLQISSSVGWESKLDPSQLQGEAGEDTYNTKRVPLNRLNPRRWSSEVDQRSARQRDSCVDPFCVTVPAQSVSSITTEETDESIHFPDTGSHWRERKATASKPGIKTDQASSKSTKSTKSTLSEQSNKSGKSFLVGPFPLKHSYLVPELIPSQKRKFSLDAQPKRDDLHVFTTVTLVIAFFLIAYLPRVLVLLVQGVTSLPVPPAVETSVTFLIYFNCIWNPWIYGWGNLNVRNGIKRQFAWMFRRKDSTVPTSKTNVVV